MHKYWRISIVHIVIWSVSHIRLHIKRVGAKRETDTHQADRLYKAKNSVRRLSFSHVHIFHVSTTVLSPLVSLLYRLSGSYILFRLAVNLICYCCYGSLSQAHTWYTLRQYSLTLSLSTLNELYIWESESQID